MHRTILNRCLLVLLSLLEAVSAHAAQTQDSLLVVADSIMMRELTVTGYQPVRMLGDTIVYDVASFPLPEGSRLRELLRRLPGVEVTADGSIRAQGVHVTCLLLNGRDFFSGNHSIVLDNLPAEALVDVRVYDRVNADEEDTGMRAQTEHVMDLTTEADKSRGWFSDITAAGGYKNRYSANASASRFDDVWQNMFTLSSDNLPQTFGLGDSFYEKVDRTLQEGDSYHHNATVVLGRKKGLWESSGSVYYTYGKTTSGKESLSENFLTDKRLYSRSSMVGDDRSHNFTTNFHIERRDSMTTITIDPQLTWSKGWGESDYVLASSSRPLSDVLEWTQTTSPYLLNRQTSHVDSRFHNWNMSLNAHLRRRLSRKGRTFTATAAWEFNGLSNYQSTSSSIEYFRTRSDERQLRYSDSPDNEHLLRLRLGWIEPITPQLKLKAEWGFSYRHEKMEQPVYADSVYSEALSKYATYGYLDQAMRLLVQWSPSEDLYLSVGGQYNPVRTSTRYRKSSLSVDTLRTVYNWSPEFNFYYHSDKGWNISMKYSGYSRQPSLLNLLPIVDDTDPLQLRVGNPGLKPSFVHQFSGTYFWFEPKSQTQMNLQVQGQMEQNAMTDVVDVDPVKGIRRTSVDNVNGCWQAGSTWTLVTDFVPDSYWTLDIQGDVNIVRRVGLQERRWPDSDVTEAASASTFSTRQAVLRQYLALQWRPGVFSVKPYGFFSYNGLRASQINVSPADLWLYGVGVVGRFETANGWSAAIDASRQSRRGYVDAVDNDDEWLIDLEVAYSFLKGRAAEVRLQACDLLHQHNLSHSTTSATERIEATYPHSVTQYILLSFTYRFSLMGK